LVKGDLDYPLHRAKDVKTRQKIDN